MFPFYKLVTEQPSLSLVNVIVLLIAAVTGSDDKQVKLWDVASRQALHTFYDHNE